MRTNDRDDNVGSQCAKSNTSELLSGRTIPYTSILNLIQAKACKEVKGPAWIGSREEGNASKQLIPYANIREPDCADACNNDEDPE